ncbi:SDR family NAD(P)-dependent oxidoreductase [Thermoflavimicrobium dichotomicum]|uniref:Nucleoside-diphosphate-sugar epimerase n=1 Tax=Thermoflavimicrobium dichotomicum TaxID=46223 RepID=A0A1I3L9M0_9BACL|nr:SDR family NAD(P)-dependent oxidoreductase [Thermoflavimicrobium dichotomicum]SFI81454.1 Nucleoside-diphosphate-sugar epimerase [Thermoflavimicrobium dichotomicum]
MMKKIATVLGATGGMGYWLVKECLRHGYHVRAVARSQTSLEQLFPNHPELSFIHGDVMNEETVQQTCKNASVVYHAVNVPYREWESKQIPMMTSILKGTIGLAKRLVLIHPVYSYGRSQADTVSEQHPTEPHTKKGTIRKQMEEMLMQAYEQGQIEGVIIRLPDFYGPNARNTFLYMILSSLLQKKTAYWLGSTSLEREYIYVPDAAKAILQLETQPVLKHTIWNISSGETITGKEILSIASKYLGYEAKVQEIPYWMLKLMGWFHRDMRELTEMFYLYDSRFILDSQAFRRTFDYLTFTPMETGIKETLLWMNQLHLR